MQPLPIPTKVWTNVSMDFVEVLPPSCSKTTILVVVDCLMKYANVYVVVHPYTTSTIG